MADGPASRTRAKGQEALEQWGGWSSDVGGIHKKGGDFEGMCRMVYMLGVVEGGVGHDS